MVKLEATYQQSALSLHTSHKLHTISYAKKEIKRRVSFIISRKIKSSAINLPKEIKDLDTASYKLLMKETKDTNKW